MKIARYSHYVVIILIAIFVVISASSVWQKSTTWDEPFHLTAGVTQLQTGDPRLNADHPPLARLIAAIPTLFMSLGSVADNMGVAWEQADGVNSPNAFFGTIEDRALWPARLMMLSFSVLLGALLYFWGLELFSPVRALLPLTLLVFCPPILANAPIVATDMPATSLMFASIYSWWRYLRVPNLKRLAWVCLAVGAAFAAKHTALLLVPLFIVLGATTFALPAVLSGTSKFRLKIIVGGLLIIALSTVLAIDLVYGFNGVFLTPTEYILKAKGFLSWIQIGANQLTHIWPMSLPVPLPFSYVSGLLALIGTVGEKGHLTYFLGQTGNGGWSNYFVMLLLVKLPIATLLLIGVGMVKALEGFPKNAWNMMFLLLPPLLIISVASLGKMQIGIRHILPALPFLFLISGYALKGINNVGRTTLVSVFLVCNIISCWLIYPYYLMYFNFIGGGPEQGWRISVTGDSWGQGDADLLHWLQSHRVNSLAYLPDGWGGNTLSRAGIRFSLPGCTDTGELVAMHVERLVTTTTIEEANCYAWMRLREPDEKIGYSIFLYNSKNLRPSSALSWSDFKEAQVLLNEGTNLYNNGKFEESIIASTKSLDLEPDSPLVYNNICAANNNLGRYSEAIHACSKALKLQPDFEFAKNNLAWAMKKGGQ